MKRRRYKLEILWENGVLTEISITETEKEFLEEYGTEYIILKYSLKDAEDVKPKSFQVWDKEDNPLFPIEGKIPGVPA